MHRQKFKFKKLTGTFDLQSQKKTIAYSPQIFDIPLKTAQIHKIS